MPTDSFPAALFDSIDATRLALLAAIYFGAFAVKGATGLGSLTPTIVFGALVIGAHHAVALAVMGNMLSQLQFVVHGFRFGDWAIARRVIVPNFAAAALGIWIFGRIGAPEMTLVLGLSLSLLVLLDVTGFWARLAGRIDIAHPRNLFVLSALSGLISGTTGAGGLLFLAVYLRLVKPDKTDFRATILLLGTLVVGWRAIVMVYAGHIDTQILTESLLLYPVILLGGLAGSRLFGRISERRFTHILQVVVLFGASVLVWRGLRYFLGLGA